MDILLKAETFATIKHLGQKRKYTYEDYILHPKRVVTLIATNTTSYTDEMLCAAWLHDTVEDTNTTFEEITEDFGQVVSDYVYCLTDQPCKTRKEKINNTCSRLEKSDYPVHTIKLADIIDNSESILRYDYNFATAFVNEIKVLLPYLSKGDKVLFNFVTKIIETF